MLNIDNSQSYATENNLTVALTKAGLVNWKYIVVRNREGRYTAIFPKSFIGNDHNFMYPVHKGFMVVG